MKAIAGLIQLAGFLILLLTGPSGNCGSVTNADTLRNESFSFDLLPAINRDLKICDEIKNQNGLLSIKVGILTDNLSAETQKRKQAEKQLRKQKVKQVFRTVLEVAVIVVIIII